jgi:ABC-type antimicrobial peptide transport system permease subunit
MLASQVKSRLSPIDFGLQFRPVRSDGLNAVTNAVDFGELFLSLSFFVIAAGVLLTALLFSLHVTARNHETGILSALGFSKKQIIRFRILEALLVIIMGAIAGAFAGIVYNLGIMKGLNSVWQDVVRETMLWVHVEPTTLLIGTFSGIVIALVAIWLITRNKMKQPVHTIFAKNTDLKKQSKNQKLLWNTLLIILSLAAVFGLVLYSVFTNVDQNSDLFLTAGGMFIISCLGIIYRVLKNRTVHFHPDLTTSKLVFRNITKNPGSNLSTITLLALGTFTIVITGANQQTFYGASDNNASGTGGFTFWAETSVPLIYDLNTHEGKEKYALEDEPELDSVNFIPFLNRQGDDASCLNLNQVSQPQILGINPELFDQKQSFSFANKLGWIDNNHPWLSLESKLEGDVIPAIADQTVITWGLMKKVGDTLTYLNEQGQEIKLLLVAGLKNSIFQGNILIDESVFRQNFPSSGGSQVMLIDAPAHKENAVAQLLESRLTDSGIELIPTATRLATFNSVTNTYLSVFMILGGLGVLIGTIGLGILLLRNLLERKSELAVMSALGFRKPQILKIIFLENVLILTSGIIVGLMAALIGILPSILSPAFTMNTGLIIILLIAILLSGLAWIYFPAKHSLKKISVKALQQE